MDTKTASAAFAALSQETRLAILRLLLQAGSGGVLAGDISSRLGMRQNTVSANLSVLLRADLIKNRREGRTIRYFVDLGTLRDLIGFMLEDCCGGDPALCRSAIDVLVQPVTDEPMEFSERK